ncbi:Serine/threonine-protein kinase B [Pirellulimonas nuda]|uniref:Serine/threonine-protein kinase B n=1 Tax=Pirellulimonas nuda TaxID=2528009 RepID=A0A518D7V6_9BACT|nr:molybdopterin-dependent oxidoreductase [Pirellulimonas nuda]QDU87553.1 Serine/threonine-protein kinase B [Pirellulimonas nuda]
MTPNEPQLPPNQQLVAAGKWPVVGERAPRADEAPWAIAIEGLVDRPARHALETLCGRPLVERTVDIHCVTRWSKLGANFGGLRLFELLDEAGVQSAARYVSFVSRSARGHSTSLQLDECRALDPLIVFEHEGRPLEVEHGGPVRVVVEGKYFYKSVKWLETVRLLADDRLGYWEAESGYHNGADPWREERYMAPSLSKREAERLIASRDFSHRDLRSIDAADRDLTGLRAVGALLRDANFRRCLLTGADLQGANFSNAHLEDCQARDASFRNADLEGANLNGADLKGADLRGASLLGATFSDEDGIETGRGARIDGSTRMDAAAIEQLAPPQRLYVEAHRPDVGG